MTFCSDAAMVDLLHLHVNSVSNRQTHLTVCGACKANGWAYQLALASPAGRGLRRKEKKSLRLSAVITGASRHS